MGLLSTGTSLSWEEIEKWSEFIKEHGILQFINIFNSLKERQGDLLKYGDEIEYCMINFDHKNKSVHLDVRAAEALDTLQEREQKNEKYLDSLWRMEYASYMVEGTPGKPFCCTISRIKLIETSMWLRKQELDEVLANMDPNLSSVCFSAFPRMGCPGFTYPKIEIDKTNNSISRSAFFPDAAIFLDHPRFANLTRNIRTRLGRKQKMYVPVWFDKNTKTPFFEQVPACADSETIKSMIPNQIYMDCMGFGMGCSCLQVTIQAGNIMEARSLYDQLAVIAPILMTLSACSPVWKGILSDWDCRWNVISMACDDRKQSELTGKDCDRIHKSRYDSIAMYLHPDNNAYNDIPVEYCQKHYSKLIDAGIDPILSKHVAHLFCRDPISLFKEKLLIDDETELDHFENLQSTNWQSCRFKPPPLNSSIGWRVEFRTLEVQFSCYENSIFVIFVILLSRAIIKFSLNFIVPISNMEENMSRAIIRDAVNRSKFYFRKNVKYTPKIHSTHNGMTQNHAIIDEMSIDEIFTGKKNNFIGLIPLVEEYVSSLDLDHDTLDCINQCLRFIEDRAKNRIMTPATWMRHFIRNHPKYQFDSLVSDEIIYDLTCKIKNISDGKAHCPLLLGSRKINKIPPARIESYKKMIQIESVGNTEKKLGLLERKTGMFKVTKQWEILESLFKHYRFYANLSIYSQNFGAIFE